MRLLQALLGRPHEALGVLLRDDAFGLEGLGVLREHTRLALDSRRHERLRVRRLVLLVVPEAPVSDQVDHDVGAEAPPERHGEPDRGQRGLGIVGVDVDDREVEALREVARVPRRAPVDRVGREADLVVRDHVERAAGRVPGQVGEVERLGDDALTREGRVAVDQDRHRDHRVVVARAGRAVGLLRTRPAFDDGIDRLEVARVRRERERDLPSRSLAEALGAEVVLDVTGSAARVVDDGVERPLALELAQDCLVRTAEHVCEHVQSPAVCHPEDNLVCSFLGGDCNRLVEHGNHHVQALDRELLLPEERAAQIALETLDLREPLEQAAFLVRGQRLAVATRLDHGAQPHPLLVVGDVLDLVGARAAVDLAKAREDVGRGLAGDVHAEERGRDPRLQLRGQRGVEPLGLERRVADRLRPERVESRRQVAVPADRLDDGNRRGHAREQLIVGLDGGRRCGCRSFGRRGLVRPRRRGQDMAVALLVQQLEQAREPGVGRDELARAALEERAPLGWHRFGVLQVLLEQRPRVAGVEAIDVVHAHGLCCTSAVPSRSETL